MVMPKNNSNLNKVADNLCGKLETTRLGGGGLHGS